MCLSEAEAKAKSQRYASCVQFDCSILDSMDHDGMEYVTWRVGKITSFSRRQGSFLGELVPIVFSGRR